MSTPNKELKEMLDELAETLLVLVHGKYEVMPNDAKPEAIWTMLADMTNGIIRACKQLATMSDRVSPDMILEDISNNKGDETSTSAKDIIKGMRRFSRTGRIAIFDDERRNLPPPRKNLDSKCAVRVLHEMIFVESDCFLSLSSIQPGSHGWIIIFRDELKDWLLSAVEPFHVLYEDRQGKRTYYGIYTARLLSRASMNGAEIACLSDTVNEIIVTALSRSERGSEPYNTMKDKLLLSLKTLPCILLQCMEFLPVMYPNFMTDVAQLAQPVPTRLAQSRPPGLLSPVSAPVERETRHSVSNLPSQLHVVPVPPCEQRTQSSQHVFRPSDNDKTPRVQSTSLQAHNNSSSTDTNVPLGSTPTPSMTVTKCSSVLYDAPSSYDDRWYNIGNPDNTQRRPSRSRVFAGHQTWHQDHQNDNLVNNSNRIRGPVLLIGPRPLQSSAHSNHEPHNRQSNPSFVSHNGTGPNPQDPGLRSKSQSYSATDGVPRGYRVQNQSINPICNYPSPQIARSSRGLCPPNGSLYLPTSLSSQNFPLSQHGTADSRFRNPQFYRVQRMQ